MIIIIEDKDGCYNSPNNFFLLRIDDILADCTKSGTHV